jgi:hypothetical protein
MEKLTVKEDTELIIRHSYGNIKKALRSLQASIDLYEKSPHQDNTKLQERLKKYYEIKENLLELLGKIGLKTSN